VRIVMADANADAVLESGTAGEYVSGSDFRK
jgi:hypothetical protein